MCDAQPQGALLIRLGYSSSTIINTKKQTTTKPLSGNNDNESKYADEVDFVNDLCEF